MSETVPNPSSPRAALLRWLWALGAVVLVTAAAVLTWRITQTDSPAPNSSQAATAPSPARLKPGHDYYVHIKIIELTEQMPDGDAWDSVGDSGPDIRFSLTWRKNGIWKAPEKSDTLIGSWDLLKVDVKQIVTSGGQTDIDSLVNAPLVHYQPGEQVELTVWDNDSIGSDDAGTITLKLDELPPGESTLLPELGKNMAVKRVVLSMIDRKTPLPELVETISNR